MPTHHSAIISEQPDPVSATPEMVLDVDAPIDYALTTSGRRAIHDETEPRDLRTVHDLQTEQDSLTWERLPSGEFAWLRP